MSTEADKVDQEIATGATAIHDSYLHRRGIHVDSDCCKHLNRTIQCAIQKSKAPIEAAFALEVQGHLSAVKRVQDLVAQLAEVAEQISTLSTKIAMAARLQRLTEDNQVAVLKREELALERIEALSEQFTKADKLYQDTKDAVHERDKRIEALVAQLAEANAQLAIIEAEGLLPNDHCLYCCGDNGHHEDCKGVSGAMALSHQLSILRAQNASLVAACKEKDEALDYIHERCVHTQVNANAIRDITHWSKTALAIQPDSSGACKNANR